MFEQHAKSGPRERRDEHSPSPEPPESFAASSPPPDTSDAEIIDIARQLSDAIDRASPEERATLSEFARDVVQEETDEAIRRAEQSDDAFARRKRPLGAFAAALLLLLVGGFFLIAFPPVGVVLLLIGLVTVLWGIVQEAMAHRHTA